MQSLFVKFLMIKHQRSKDESNTIFPYQSIALLSLDIIYTDD